MSPRRYLVFFVLVLPLMLTPLFAGASILLFYRNDMAQTIILSLNRPTDVLFFGDSVLRARSACDTDQRGIDDYLAEATGKRVLLVANAGYSSRQYVELAGLLENTRHLPEVVVIGINLRSFGQTWAGDPNFRHENDMRYVRALQGDVLSLLALAGSRILDETSDDSWLDQPLVYAGQSYGSLREIGQQSVGPPLAVECMADAARFAPQLRLKFLVQYLFTMREDDAELDFVLRLARRLAALGAVPVFYLTPINVEDAAALAGPHVAEAIRTNTALIRRVMAREGIAVLDLATALGPASFADKGCSCEHLRAEGRRFVAERLAAEVKSVRP